MPAATLPTTSRSIVIQHHAKDSIVLDGPNATFALKVDELPSSRELPAAAILVQILYLSNDPVQRVWIQEDSPHPEETVPAGSVMKAFAVGKVLAVGEDKTTTESKFKEGDFVIATTGWSDFAVLKKSDARVVPEISGLSLSVWLGALGAPGLTAYQGLVEVLEAKSTDTLVVSGAAGAVGNVVVQYAKHVLGLKHVVAIAGSQAKCDWLKSIGADAVVNYKSPSFEKDLAEATPDRAELYFDNVGGSILDAVLLRMKPQGKVAACGSISSYNDSQRSTFKNYLHLILNRLHIIGFRVDHMERVDEGTEALTKAVQEGKLVVHGAETVVDIKGDIEAIPRVWAGLFEGVNTGKLITKL